jgi:hypothetical protein
VLVDDTAASESQQARLEKDHVELELELELRLSMGFGMRRKRRLDGRWVGGIKEMMEERRSVMSSCNCNI